MKVSEIYFLKMDFPVERRSSQATLSLSHTPCSPFLMYERGSYLPLVPTSPSILRTDSMFSQMWVTIGRVKAY